MTLAAAPLVAPRLVPGLDRLRPLLQEIGDAKRVRTAGAPGSLCERAFGRAWARLVDGEEPERVALSETAAAVARARLAGIDGPVLRRAGLTSEQALDVLRRGYDEVADAVPSGVRDRLRDALPDVRPAAGPPPGLVAALNAQPRAGATAPGRPRLVVEPPESHGDHCLTVAVYGVLLAPLVGADPVVPFLVGIAHHLHNVTLPDAGFAGEVLLGEHLAPVLDELERQELDRLPQALGDRLRGVLGLRADAGAPESQAFHAADVLDRVLQQRYHAAAAGFTLEHALEELELVHEGPLQAYGLQVLAEAGLR